VARKGNATRLPDEWLAHDAVQDVIAGRSDTLDLGEIHLSTGINGIPEGVRQLTGLRSLDLGGRLGQRISFTLPAWPAS
jgi:hypothetical protein